MGEPELHCAKASSAGERLGLAAARRRRGLRAPGLAVDLGPPVAGPVPLADLLPFPIHAVVGHPLAVEVLAPAPGRTALYFRGRLHSYQGYDAHQTVFPVRLGPPARCPRAGDDQRRRRHARRPGRRATWC